jgi:transposase
MAAVRQALTADPRCWGLARSRWRLADLRTVIPALASYSLSGLSRLCHRLGLSRQRGRLHLHSPDPAYAAKAAAVARTVVLARTYPTRVTVCFGDEMSVYRQPTLADRWAVVQAEPTAPLSHHANTRSRLCGALNAVTGQVTVTRGSRITVAHLGRFLRTLRQTYPDRHLILVWDNWPVHSHPAIVAQAAALRIHLVWLPTYAPWLNPIEKLWRLLKQTVLHHHRLANDWAGLTTAMATFLEQFAPGSETLLHAVGLLPK